jgi:trehalose 6-phosphate synthase
MFWQKIIVGAPVALWPGLLLQMKIAGELASSETLVPVPSPSKIYQAYYGAISNEVLWMVQHHLVGQFGYSSLDAERHCAWTDGYLEANLRIARAIRESGIRPRAFLIQDYHLYPLPALLREIFPDVPSLHFTHIPFPDSATLKLIPQSWRDTILQGLLGADVVGMQTDWDSRPFLGCCEELLGAEVDYRNRTVAARDERLVRVRAFPREHQSRGGGAIDAVSSSRGCAGEAGPVDGLKYAKHTIRLANQRAPKQMD